METAAEEDLSTDDSEYWENIVEELLDIETNSPKHSKRKQSNISIIEEDLEPGPSNNTETETEQESNVLNPNLLTVEHTYIFEDSDSDIYFAESEASPDNLNRRFSFEPTSSEQDDLTETLTEEEEDKLNHTLCLPDEYREQTRIMCDIIYNKDSNGLDSFIAENEDDIGAICLVSDATGTTPVTAAASLGSLAALEQLLAAGVWLYCFDAHGYMAIHRAAENGHVEVVEWLAKQGQWAGTTKDGVSALHIAAKCGHFQVTSTLLEYTPNVDGEGLNDGYTALHLAVLNGHRDIAELLIGKGADVNHIHRSGKTALHMAAEEGETSIVDLLLMYSSPCSQIDCVTSDSKKTALFLAVENSHDQTVCKLLDGGANVDIKDGTNETVLHQLHKYTLPAECMSQICSHSKNIDMKTPKGRTALFLAVEKGNIETCKILIDNGSDPNIEINTGCTPLYAATHHGHWDIVDKLIQAGADVNKQTDNGSTPLYKAARNGMIDIVALLLCSNAKLDLARKTGWTPLHVAVHHGHTTIVEQLAAAGANINAADTQKQTPLAIAAYCKSKEMVKILKKCCEDPVSVYNVAKLGNREVLKFLKACGYNMEVTHPLVRWRALHYAAQEGHYNAIAALGSVKVDINCQTNDGDTPLHVAILHKHARAVDTLLNLNCYGSIVNNAGYTALSLAVQRGSSTMVQLLLRHGAVVDDPDRNGKRPITHAIERGHKIVVRLLMAHGAAVNSYEDDRHVCAPVRLVCQYGDGELLKLMANSGARIEQRDAHRNTLLHTACQYGKLDVVLELITMRGSLVNAENSAKKKPLHVAAVEGHAFIVESLLAAGTKVSIMEADNTVIYDMAKHKPVWEVLKHWASAHPSMLVPTPGARSGHQHTRAEAGASDDISANWSVAF